MNQYYLVSQLPSISPSIFEDEKLDLPITEDRFLDLCSRFLDKKSFSLLNNLSLEPPKIKKSTGSRFLDLWFEKERALRLCLAEIRALHLKKKFDFSEFGEDAVSFSPEIVNAARSASSMESPLEAEKSLNAFRISVIDNIFGGFSDAFSVDAIFAYGLKLKLASRMKKFRAESGLSSYHQIYDEILNRSGENK